MAFFRSSTSRKLALRSLPFALLAALPAAAAVGCSSKEPTSAALMLVMSTNMELPDDVGAVGLYVKNGDTTVFEEVHETYQVTDPVSGATRVVVDLPATFAVRPPAGGAASVVVRVVAYDKNTGAPVVLRTAQSLIPTDRIGLLRMPLDWMNQTTVAQTATADTTPIVPTRAALERYGLHLTADPRPTGKKYISPGKVLDCNTADAPDALVSRAGGICGTAVFADSNQNDLPDFTPDQVFGAPDLASARCFDTAPCMATMNSQLVDLDSLAVEYAATGSTSVNVSSCTTILKDGPSGKDADANMNVAVLTPERANAPRGKCKVLKNGKHLCMALVTQGSGSENWQYNESSKVLSLPKGYCSESFQFRRSAKLLVAFGEGACQKRKPNQPFCIPLRASKDREKPRDGIEDFPYGGTNTHLATTGKPLSIDAAPSVGGPVVYAFTSDRVGGLKVEGARAVNCGFEKGDFAPLPPQAVSGPDPSSSLRIGIYRGATDVVLSSLVPPAQSASDLYFTPLKLDRSGPDEFKAAGMGTFVAATAAQGVSFVMTRPGGTTTSNLDGLFITNLLTNVTKPVIPFNEKFAALAVAKSPALIAAQRFIYGIAQTQDRKGDFSVVRYPLTNCETGKALVDCPNLTVDRTTPQIFAKVPAEVTRIDDMQVNDTYVVFSAMVQGQRHVYSAAIPKVRDLLDRIPAVTPLHASDGSLPGPIALDGSCVYAFGDAQDNTRPILCLNPAKEGVSTPVVNDASVTSTSLTTSGGAIFWSEPAANDGAGGVIKCLNQLPTAN